MRRSPPKYCYLVLPLDLHVLSLPLAFILSQDQTLHCINCLFCLFKKQSLVSFKNTNKSSWRDLFISRLVVYFIISKNIFPFHAPLLNLAHPYFHYINNPLLLGTTKLIILVISSKQKMRYFSRLFPSIPAFLHQAGNHLSFPSTNSLQLTLRFKSGCKCMQWFQYCKYTCIYFFKFLR